MSVPEARRRRCFSHLINTLHSKSILRLCSSHDTDDLARGIIRSDGNILVMEEVAMWARSWVRNFLEGQWSPWLLNSGMRPRDRAALTSLSSVGG